MEKLRNLASVLAKLGYGEHSDLIYSLAGYSKEVVGKLILWPFSISNPDLIIDLSKADEAALKEYIKKVKNYIAGLSESERSNMEFFYKNPYVESGYTIDIIKDKIKFIDIIINYKQLKNLSEKFPNCFDLEIDLKRNFILGNIKFPKDIPQPTRSNEYLTTFLYENVHSLVEDGMNSQYIQDFVHGFYAVDDKSISNPILNSIHTIHDKNNAWVSGYNARKRIAMEGDFMAGDSQYIAESGGEFIGRDPGSYRRRGLADDVAFEEMSFDPDRNIHEEEVARYFIEHNTLSHIIFEELDNSLQNYNLNKTTISYYTDHLLFMDTERSIPLIKEKLNYEFSINKSLHILLKNERERIIKNKTSNHDLKLIGRLITDLISNISRIINLSTDIVGLTNKLNHFKNKKEKEAANITSVLEETKNIDGYEKHKEFLKKNLEKCNEEIRKSEKVISTLNILKLNIEKNTSNLELTMGINLIGLSD